MPDSAVFTIDTPGGRPRKYLLSISDVPADVIGETYADYFGGRPAARPMAVEHGATLSVAT